MNDSIFVEHFDDLIARTRADGRFKADLMADPRGTLERVGIEVPEGLTVEVLQNTEKVFNLVLPRAPDLGLCEESLCLSFDGAGRPSCPYLLALSFYSGPCHDANLVPAQGPPG